VATRRSNLRRLINSLNLLNGELATRKDDLAQLIDTSATVFRALASEDQNISRAVADFPGALRQTTTTLGKVKTFADVLGPTAEKLRPAVRTLNRANAAVIPFARETAPVLRTQIRPFVRDARPVVRDLRPAASNLAKATPDVTKSFTVLNHLFNLVGYNPNGREGPENPARQEGYLFWIAWATHIGTNLFSSGDANGPYRPVFIGGRCEALKNIVAQNPLFGAGLNLAPILGNPALCPP
jgi:phospholipid/cholesterol/gamma-HCH transport system substrate-binding protein